MLCVTHHGNRYIAYKDAALNRILLVVMEPYKLLTDAVGYSPAVYHQERMQSAALNDLQIAVYLSLCLLIAHGVYDHCQSVNISPLAGNCKKRSCKP